MTILNTVRGTALTVLAALALAVPGYAIAAPGDDYLPVVPTPTGDKPTQEAPGLGNPEPSPATSDEVKAKQRPKKRSKPVAERGAGIAGPIAPVATLADDSSGAFDGLLDPLLIILILGVLATVTGIIMAQRHRLHAEGEQATGDLHGVGGTPETPMGEIVGDDGEAETKEL